MGSGKTGMGVVTAAQGEQRRILGVELSVDELLDGRAVGEGQVLCVELHDRQIAGHPGIHRCIILNRAFDFQIRTTLFSNTCGFTYFIHVCACT